jgi:hypothetical protein
VTRLDGPLGWGALRERRPRSKSERRKCNDELDAGHVVFLFCLNRLPQ